MKIVVDGVEEFLPEDKEAEFGSAFKEACGSLETTIEIITSPGFDERSTWKFDTENEHIKVYYKDIKGKRFFAARTEIPLSCADGLHMNWENIRTMSEWNDNIRFSRILASINEHCDVANYASNKKFMVDSREFLAGRILRVTKDGHHIVSARSCDFASHTPDGGAVQAYLYLGAGVYAPVPHNANASTYEYILCMDLKGYLPSSVVNQVLGKLVLADVENNRKNAIRVHEERH